ncbi:hypothetical protein BJ878DRAFT_204535 [Calycina marina]|uniref:Uncharacterized protein n=1 Tax=Calycina marina TaxID=1763456 RepID=A0A9P8CJ86_9HELO|nr:hypothetical protein BJ878DRAFT_204535 [Calycina marina]
MIDAAFAPTELLVKHILNLNVGSAPVSHKITLELGESITNLGRPIRNLFLVVVAAYSLLSVIKTTVAILGKREKE